MLGVKQEPFLFVLLQNGIFKVRVMTVSFVPKEMSRHVKDKFSEMEGRQTSLNGSY